MLIIISINIVYAQEYPDITSDIEIKYKWYKEKIIGGEYISVNKIKENDKFDKNNYKYVGKGNVYSEDYCLLPTENYLIKEKIMRDYKMPYPTTYVLIDNIENRNDIKIYYENKIINFDIIGIEGNQIKINLKQECICDKLLFFVDTNNKYKITLYRDVNFNNKILSKQFENEKTSTPDDTWVSESNEVFVLKTSEKLEETSLTKLLKEQKVCSYKEKYVYKYEVIKDYYDDGYYLYVENYQKDINDFKIYYKGEPIVNTIEIVQEKIVEVPKNKYIYLEKNDSSNQNECKSNVDTEMVVKRETKIVEKVITKVPKKIYIIILILLTIVILLLIRIMSKKIFSKYCRINTKR